MTWLLLSGVYSIISREAFNSASFLSSYSLFDIPRYSGVDALSDSGTGLGGPSSFFGAFGSFSFGFSSSGSGSGALSALPLYSGVDAELFFKFLISAGSLSASTSSIILRFLSAGIESSSDIAFLISFSFFSFNSFS